VKCHFYLFFILLLLINSPLVLLGMEAPDNQPESETSNTVEAQPANLAELLGFNNEEFRNPEKLEAYLTHLQKILSLYAITKKLTNKIKKFTTFQKARREAVKFNGYFIQEFNYTDKPCDIKILPNGCQIIYDNEKPTIYENGYMLQSSEGKAAYLQATKLLNIKNLNFDEKISNAPTVDKTINAHAKWTPFITALLESDNKELNTLAHWFEFLRAHEQYMKIIAQSITLTIDFLSEINPLMARSYKGMTPKEKTDFIINQQFNEALITGLNDITPVIEIMIPAFFQLTNTLQLIIQYTFQEDIQDRNYEKNNKLYESLKEHNEFFEKSLRNYDALYATLQRELTSYFPQKNRARFIKKYSQHYYFNDKKLPTTLLKKEKIDTTNTIDLIEKLTLEEAHKKEEQKKVQQRNQQKRQSKNARKKRALKNRTAAASPIVDISQEEPESIEAQIVTIIDEKSDEPKQHDNLQAQSIVYDGRILRWFYDDDFIKAEKESHNLEKFQESMLYHTYAPLVDILNRQYGIKKQQKNKSHNNQWDTVYYLGGEIHYPNGLKETVLFACCFDPHDICYHRGLEKKENNLFKEFEKNKFAYNFPQGFKEPTFEKKTLDLDDFTGEYLTPPSSFCFKIKDDRNKVTIVLFKPDFK
jgi:hypothetical protein